MWWTPALIWLLSLALAPLLADGQQYIQRPLSATSTMFELFARTLAFTGSPDTDSVAVQTTLGQNLNGHRFLDLVLGLEDFEFLSTIAGFYFDFELRVGATLIRVNFLSGRCSNCGSAHNLFTFRGVFFCMDREAPYHKYRLTYSPQHRSSTSVVQLMNYTIPYPLTSRLLSCCYSEE
jgi:hypothetical protein